MKLYINYYLLILLFVQIPSTLRAQDTSIKIYKNFNENPRPLDSFSSSIPHHLIKNILWPSEEEINFRKFSLNEKTVQYPLHSTKKWLKTILHSAWIPEESQIEILALRAGKNGSEMVTFDSVIMRFRTDDHCIQITSDSRDMVFVIRAINSYNTLNNKSNNDIENINKYINEMINKFFNASEKIIKTCNWKSTSSGHGFEGFITNYPTTWWGSIGWWTDGATTVFTLQKLDQNHPRPPVFEPNWFSPQPKQNIHKRLVTRQSDK